MNDCHCEPARRLVWQSVMLKERILAPVCALAQNDRAAYILKRAQKKGAVEDSALSVSKKC